MIQLIRGFKDILPGEIESWQYVTNKAVTLFHDFGYCEICTPIMERTDLFARSIGESTDIIEKEMYTLSDAKGAFISLRPEATASIVRAYVQHKMYNPDADMKLYTIGPMFRKERPQKGRYRQFSQIDVEVFGVQEPNADAELIFMLYTLLSERLLIENMSICLNSLGCPSCRPEFKTYLIKFISRVEGELCVECIRRKDRNPFRVLDCKVESCREATRNVKSIIDFLCYDCKKHFEGVTELLSCLAVPFKVERHLVRGLDYYTRTTFEIHHSDLGAQSSIAGGGRYDGLVKMLGGPDIPAIGFAIGFNRLIELINLTSKKDFSKFDLFIAPLGEEAMKVAFIWQMDLNKCGVRAIIGSFKKKLKFQMRRANRIRATHVLIIGEQEMENREVILRYMDSGRQFSIPMDNLLFQLKEIIFKMKMQLK